MKNRVNLGGLGNANAMMATKKGVINLYITMIRVASKNIGRRTLYDVLITEDFVERLEKRLATLQSSYNLRRENI